MIKAIETVYNGYRFRSRLEARWAVFFTHLGLVYQYEPEGYDLSGLWYLPDFWLPTLDCWIEVKAQEPTEEEIRKANLLGETTRHKVVIMWQEGDIGEYAFPREWSKLPGDGYWLAWPHWDNFYQFCFCESCGAVGLEFEGRSDRMKCKASACERTPHGDKGRNFDHPRLVAAYTAARQARFEHGESPWTLQQRNVSTIVAVG